MDHVHPDKLALADLASFFSAMPPKTIPRLFPENILPFVREGMEFPVRVSPSNRMSIEIDWEPLMVHYPGSAVSTN